MSFSIYLYQITQDRKTLSKTLTLKGSILNCNFRGDYDVLNPVIIVDTTADNIIDASLHSMSDTFINNVNNGTINYASITDNGVTRYYYITVGLRNTNNLIAIVLHEDVLKTFDSLIRQSTGIVRRNENLYNLYINDPKIELYANPVIRRKVFTGGFTPNTPSKYITVANSAQVNNTSQTFNITTALMTRLSAKNGVEIVWFPNCAVSGVEKNYLSYDDFKSNPVGQWVLCPTNACYLNTNYVDDNDNYPATNTMCVAKIEGVTQYTDSINELYLTPITTYPATTQTITITRFPDNGSTFIPQPHCYAWSYGGELDWAAQNVGVELWLNTVSQDIRLYRHYDQAKQLTLNPSITNDIQFISYW